MTIVAARRRVIVLAIVFLLPAAPVLATYRGRPLTDVLEELRSRGLNLMFSTAVVRSDLIVLEEPDAKDPRKILDQVLSPLGLKAETGVLGTLLIVPAVVPPERPVEGARLVENVVVTPPQRAVVTQELGAVRSLSGDDVAFAPTLGNDPSRAVTLLPGVAASDASATFHARGSESGDVAMILDGLELYDPFHLGAMQHPFSFVDSRIVDAVDLIDGGFTADRGDRHGGFLDISSMTAAETSTQLEAGTLNSRVAYAAPTPFGKLLASARYWYPEADDGTMTFGSDGLHPKFGDAYVKLGLLSTPRTEISGHLLLASDRATLTEETGSEHLDSSNRSSYLWFRALGTWSPTFTTDTIVSAGKLDRGRQGIAEPQGTPVALDDQREVEFFGVRNDATWTLGHSQVLRGGLDAQFQDTDLAYSLGPPGAPALTAVARSGASIGAYAAYRATIGSSVVAETGLRWDQQTYTGDSQWSPRLNLVWKARDGSEFRLGAGRYTQSLRINELRIEDGETTYGPPEVSRQLDLTFVHRFASRLSLRVDAYRHEIEHLQPRYENLYNPIELFPEVEPDRVRVAPTAATLQGMEISAQGEAGRPFQWAAHYTWSSAMDRIDGVDVPRSWDQTHAGSVLAGYRWRSGWFLSSTGTVHTGWPTTPATGTVVTRPDGTTSIESVPGPRNSDRFPTYLRFDLKTGRTWATAKGSLRVELSVTNVTNRQNACCIEEYRFAETPGGELQRTTVYDHWLGITPTLQVLWTF